MRLNRSHPEPVVDDVVRVSRAWYDRKARDYDRRTGSYARFPGLIDEIGRFADDLTPHTGPVLDLGCGTGRDTEFLHERGLPVVCADLSTAMLRATTARCQVPAVQLDMRALPFRTGTLVGAWVCASLLHLPRTGIPAVLDELHRVLCVGGRVAVSMRQPVEDEDGYQNGRWFTYIDSEDFVELLGANGFTRCVAEPSGRGNWYIAHATKP